MGELTTLPGIAKKLEAQLHDVGIDTIDELRTTGGKEAWRRILECDPSACMNRLRSLEGAARGIKKAELDEATIEELKDYYKYHKGK